MAEYKVLLVDDDTDILEINRAFLESEGYEVVTATSIAQTMEKVQTHNFDCIVLDVMLPDGSAFELPPRIQVYSTAPIIFLTARE
ncbi:MAG: response regulator [Clostridiales bacterium]|nr:response regulator [Clostridiales bacterium]